MFFPDRLKSILPTDKVLEIGPGANPHPRADILLEKVFNTDDEYFEQRGKTEIKSECLKPIIYYDGEIFPFQDKEFDYVICSHVLEHVKNIDQFVQELIRISRKGYLEFPTLYYDYIYNFKVHISFVFSNNGVIYWMPKNQSELDSFNAIQKFFQKTLDQGYFTYINDFKNYFFQGFEWFDTITTERVTNLSDLCIQENITIHKVKNEDQNGFFRLTNSIPIHRVIKLLKKPFLLKFWGKQRKGYIKFEKDFEEFRRIAEKSSERFQLRIKDKLPCLHDSSDKTDFDPHYIYHTSWAARTVKKIKPDIHVDISSYLYFSTILSAFLPVKFYDFRPANIKLSNLEMHRADICNLPFDNNSIQSLSCMHVVEHIGLGRYGDPLDYDGDLKAINELKRVLKPGGSLIFVVPIGKSKIVFNAHRIYSFEQIKAYFNEFELLEFSLIPDNGNETGIIENADQEMADHQIYACGCFWFKK